MSFFCENCGKQLPDGSMFCEECGTPVPQDMVQPAPSQGPVQMAPPTQGYYDPNTGQPIMPGNEIPDPQAGNGGSGLSPNLIKKIAIGVAAVAVIAVGVVFFMKFKKGEPGGDEPNVSITQDQPGGGETGGEVTVVKEDTDGSDQQKPTRPSAFNDNNGNGSEIKDDKLENPEEPIVPDEPEEPEIKEEPAEPEKPEESVIKEEEEKEEKPTTSFFTNLNNDDEKSGEKKEDTEKEKNDSKSDGQIFSDSSSRLLKESEVSALTDDELRYAINEIYARHGYIFKDSGLLAYYKQFPWYDPSIPSSDFSQKIFNDTEYQNVLMMQKERDSRR